jgi:hypothetical protein
MQYSRPTARGFILPNKLATGLSRRDALALAGAAALASPALQAGGHARRVAFDSRSARQNLDVFIRITGSADPEQEVLMHNQARVFSVIGDDEILRPLFDMEGFKIRRSVALDDGGYHILQREVFVYKDLESGEIINEWFNPFTGETVEVVHLYNNPVNHHITTVFPRYYNPGTEERQVEPEPFVMPWSILGDEATFFFDTNTKWKNVLDPKIWKRESTGEYVRVTESEWYTASLADIENPDLASVPYVGGWSRLGPWLPWMFMGGKPGHLRYRGKKTKLDSIADLNEPLRSYVREVHGDLHAPTEFTEPNESSFESYARSHKPRA